MKRKKRLSEDVTYLYCKVWSGITIMMLCPGVIRIKISIFLKISRKRWWVAIFFLKIWRRNVYQRSSRQLHLVGATWQNRLQVQYDDETGTSVWHSERARRSKGTVEGKGKALLPRTFFLYSRTRNFLARPHPFEPRGLYYVYYWQHCVAANWVKHLKRTGQNIQFKIKHK